MEGVGEIHSERATSHNPDVTCAGVLCRDPPRSGGTALSLQRMDWSHGGYRNLADAVPLENRPPLARRRQPYDVGAICPRSLERVG